VDRRHGPLGRYDEPIDRLGPGVANVLVDGIRAMPVPNAVADVLESPTRFQAMAMAIP
jgi:hypothetical protein